MTLGGHEGGKLAALLPREGDVCLSGGNRVPSKLIGIKLLFASERLANYKNYRVILTRSIQKVTLVSLSCQSANYTVTLKVNTEVTLTCLRTAPYIGFVFILLMYYY